MSSIKPSIFFSSEREVNESMELVENDLTSSLIVWDGSGDCLRMTGTSEESVSIKMEATELAEDIVSRKARVRKRLCLTRHLS